MSASSQLSEQEMAQVVALRDALGTEMSAMLTDNDCMRFVRARKNDISKAANMASNWATWWKTPFADESLKHMSPSNILHLQEVDPDEDIYTELCPHALYGFSKEGHPIYWERTGIISNSLKTLKKKTNLNKLHARHVRIQELNRARLYHTNKKLGKSNTANEIEKTIIVFDMLELGMSPDLFGINYVKDMFGCDGNYYPERLHKMLMINAPWYFSAIWALVSFCVDPVTAEKIVIVGSDYEGVLREYIDEENIPKEMGGLAEVDWHCPYAEGSGCSPDEIKEYLASQTTDSIQTLEDQKKE